MANKFQKSVLERLEQENIRQKRTTTQKSPAKPAAEIATEPAKQTEPLPELPVTAEAPVTGTESTAPVPPEQPKASLPTDIGAFLRPAPQRLAKNKTFYLDADLIDAIKATARAQSVTDSKLVNDILRRVLGVDSPD